MKAFRSLIAAVTLGSAMVPAMAFTPIDVSTDNPGWQARYAGGTGPALRFSAGCQVTSCLSISSTGFADGQFVGGGTAADFDGRWTATLDFVVPASPGGARLDLQLYGVDDRATYRLNGKPLLTQFYVLDTVTTISVVNGPLVAGALYRLEIDVVNSPRRADGRPKPFQYAGDGTALNFGGTVSPLP